MHKIKKVHVLLEILVANQHQFIRASELTTKLANKADEEVSQHSVKKYLDEIRDVLGYHIETKEGPEGGYKIAKESAEAISRLAGLSLNYAERNALNDAFEIAERMVTFHYKADLKNALDKLYTKYNLKDDDYEYYVGYEKRHNNELKLLIEKIKKSIIEKRRICMTSKYQSYNGITKEQMHLLIPLFIVHDNDESFVILKNHDQNGAEFLYQNILNIKTWEDENASFNEHNYKIGDFINSHTIKVKGEYILRFDITTERGFEIFDTWNYDFKDLKPSADEHKEICFYEKYRVFEFLLRMKPYIANLEANQAVLTEFYELLERASK